MSNKCPNCGSCGMPMEKTADFALGNAKSQFCTYCTDKQGKLLPFDTVLASNAKYYMESQGITEVAAFKMASEFLASQPAWKARAASRV